VAEVQLPLFSLPPEAFVAEPLELAAELIPLPPEALVVEVQLPLLSLPPEAFVSEPPELMPVTPLGAEQLPLPSAPPELSTPLSIPPSQPPPARGAQLQVDTSLVAAIYTPPPTLSQSFVTAVYAAPPTLSPSLASTSPPSLH
jgi:hypothetical protein